MPLQVYENGTLRDMTQEEEDAHLAQQALDQMISPEAVKLEAARRIGVLNLSWLVERELTGGKPVPEEIKQTAQHIRDRSNEIERMKPVPHNFRDDSFWE